MANPDRWREPQPGEWVITLGSHTIESGEYAMWRDLCVWPNRYDFERSQVQWAIPEPQWLLILLRWPELAKNAQKA